MSFDSTDPRRVANSSNSMRHQYRELDAHEKADVIAFKDIGEAFVFKCRKLSDATYKNELKREFALAITHMEDAVMRAVRGITG